jgi:rod shape-determining protein MreC
VVRAAHDFWHDYLSLSDVKRENQLLRMELARYQGEPGVDKLENENHRLSKVMKLREALGMQKVAANVIGSDATGLSLTLILGAGSDEGLAPGMAVVSSQGAVGKLISADPS